MTRRLAVTALALALAGCSAVQGVESHLPAREPQPGPDDGAFADLRDAASRGDRLYDGFLHRADLNGTWLSPEVRQAGTRRMGAWQGWSPAELESALAADQADAAKGEQFVLSLYTADRKHNDLANRGSVWRVVLDDGTTQATASSVTIETIDANTLQLFPYVGRFDTVYRVRVPWTGAPLAGRPFTLKLMGAVGTLELDFSPKGRKAGRTHPAP